MATKRPQLYLSGVPAADELLSTDPLALLVGMVLDQQIPLEWAFQGPLSLTQRLGSKLDARQIAEMSTDDLVASFAARPALHRFPASMAGRVQELCRQIVAEYGGKPARIWTTAKTGDELLRRLQALPGFGTQKAKIFLALLGKQYGAEPAGWVEASDPFGEPGSHLSVADIDSPDSLVLVREHKRAMKAAANAAQPAAEPAAVTAGAGSRTKRPATGTKTVGAAKRPVRAKATTATKTAGATKRAVRAKATPETKTAGAKRGVRATVTTGS